MGEYTSCHWLQHGISFEQNHIEMCCLCCHKGGGKLIVKDNYDGMGVNWDDIFKLKEKFIQENKNGFINSKCEGCFNLVHKNWDDEFKYINYVHFNHWTNCNSDCIYCYTSWNKQYYQKLKHYKVVPIIKKLFENKLFKPNGEITFAGGEPAILDEFDKIVNLFIKNGAERITVHSSGIKYSKAIEKGIKEKRLTVCLSADSGNRETYKKIKRVDKFEVFWKNAKKYAKLQVKFTDKCYVETKFILIPNVNTNKEEIDKWLELNIKAGIQNVVVDIENEFFKKVKEGKIKIPRYIIDLSAYIVKRAEDLGLKLIEYNNFRYLHSENNF